MDAQNSNLVLVSNKMAQGSNYHDCEMSFGSFFSRVYHSSRHADQFLRDTVSYVSRPYSALHRHQPMFATLSVEPHGMCRRGDWVAHQKWTTSQPEQTEAIITGTYQQIAKFDQSLGINVSGTTVPFSSKLRVLGVTLDSRLSFDDHVTSVVRACNYHNRALRHIRHLIDRETANVIACSIVSSRLDYCNAILCGVTSRKSGSVTTRAKLAGSGRLPSAIPLSHDTTSMFTTLAAN